MGNDCETHRSRISQLGWWIRVLSSPGAQLNMILVMIVSSGHRTWLDSCPAMLRDTLGFGARWEEEGESHWSPTCSHQILLTECPTRSLPPPPFRGFPRLLLLHKLRPHNSHKQTRMREYAVRDSTRQWEQQRNFLRIEQERERTKIMFERVRKPGTFPRKYDRS